MHTVCAQQGQTENRVCVTSAPGTLSMAPISLSTRDRQLKHMLMLAFTRFTQHCGFFFFFFFFLICKINRFYPGGLFDVTVALVASGACAGVLLAGVFRLVRSSGLRM